MIRVTAWLGSLASSIFKFPPRYLYVREIKVGKIIVIIRNEI